MRLWYRTPTSGWISLGGLITSNLAVTTDGNSLYVAGAGADQALWTRKLTGSTWSGWQSLGGAVTSPPASTYDPTTGSGYLVAVGSDGAVWYQGVASGAWSGWYGLGGLAASTPAVIARTGGLDVYVVGVDLAMWQQRWERRQLVGLAEPGRRLHLRPGRHDHQRPRARPRQLALRRADPVTTI